MQAVAILLCLVLGAAPAIAQQEVRPLPARQSFKLDAESGCFGYRGTAAEFVGHFKRGAYVTVTMQTLDASGRPVPASEEQRIPVLDEPGHATGDGAYWFGPLPKTGPYVITFMPQSAFGHPANVVICGRTFAPGSPEEAAHRDKVIQDAVATDPNSQDVMNEPRVHSAVSSNEGDADVCGFPVRDVVIRAGEGADASPLQPRVAGSIRHYANLYESPFDVFAVCTPAEAGQPAKTVKLPANTKDCYVAGGKLECSYLANGETVPAE
ncbi:hypothetical protein OK142_20910 [Agrobacterium sp. BT-220-3]|nr:hypothetical protein [Agrobacterium sp. BT-220-3]